MGLKAGIDKNMANAARGRIVGTDQADRSHHESRARAARSCVSGQYILAHLFYHVGVASNSGAEKGRESLQGSPRQVAAPLTYPLDNIYGGTARGWERGQEVKPLRLVKNLVG